MVAGTGSSIVIPMVRQMRVSDRTRTVLILESALSAVFCIVVALALMEGIKMGRVRIESIVGNVLASFFMALLLGVVGGIIWSGLLQRVRRTQNSMFLTPAFVFVIYGVTQALGYSGAIAALAFGIVLGNASYFEFSFLRKIYKKRPPSMQSLEEVEKTFFKEMVFILKTFFFVYIGISIPFYGHDGVAVRVGDSGGNICGAPSACHYCGSQEYPNRPLDCVGDDAQRSGIGSVGIDAAPVERGGGKSHHSACRKY